MKKKKKRYVLIGGILEVADITLKTILYLQLIYIHLLVCDTLRKNLRRCKNFLN